MYEKGEHVEINMNKAYNFYKQAADKNNGAACFMVGSYIEVNLFTMFFYNSNQIIQF